MALIIMVSVLSGIWCCCGCYACTQDPSKGLTVIMKVVWTAMSGVSTLCIVGAIPNINRGVAVMITAVINALIAMATCAKEWYDLQIAHEKGELDDKLAALKTHKATLNTATGLLDAYFDFVVGWAFVDGFEALLENHEDADYHADNRWLTTLIALGTFIGFSGRLAEDIAEGILWLMDEAPEGAELAIRVKMGLDWLSSMVAAGIMYPILKGIDEEIQQERFGEVVTDEVVTEDGQVTSWYAIFGWLAYLWIGFNLLGCFMLWQDSQSDD